MERVPLEVLHLILSHLPGSDLARAAQSCRALCNQITPFLYRNLDIHLRSGNPDAATHKLLTTLIRNPSLRQLIRHISVENEASTFWTAGHSKLLRLLLSTWIECYGHIRSFTWKPTSIFTDAYFPNLTHLECTKTRNRDELSWIRWHLYHCRELKSLSVGFIELLSAQLSNSLFLTPMGPFALHTLSLRGIDLSLVNPAVFVSPSLHHLGLEYCHGMDAFFCNVVQQDLAPQLRSLRIVGTMSMAILQGFLVELAKTSRLEELTLCIGSTLHPICLQCIELHASALKLLILDFRAQMHDRSSAMQYSAQQFEDILARFPRLHSLGLPLQLKDPASSRYKRARFQSLDLHKKALNTLHIRLRCRPRFELDARHVAAAFQRRGRFTVYIGQGRGLKKLVFDKGTNYEANIKHRVGEENEPTVASTALELATELQAPITNAARESFCTEF
ncbi:hypothetical protein PWT90_02188 [Aphanocladium album]|nr:hypothetical protein PWT90_02188 [Aphanocladium album]